MAAARISRDGGVVSYSEPLISTEYDTAGEQTRATLELWAGDSEEGAFAERGGGLRTAGGRGRLAGQTLAAARFDWRFDGGAGVGGYEILRAGE